MRLKAMAKINLGLDVLGKREDGYHEVRMIMQTIRMYDILDIRKTRRPGIVLTTNLPFIPTDQRNLVYKAAQMLKRDFPSSFVNLSRWQQAWQEAAPMQRPHLWV